MAHLARKIVKTYGEETGENLTNIPEEPKYKEISDYKEAKAVMKNYLETVIDMAEVKNSTGMKETNKIIKKAKEITDNPKFINPKCVRSFIVEDARVGRNSNQ